MASPSQKKPKTWVAWFQSKAPFRRSGSLLTAPVEINAERKIRRKYKTELIISIPRVCGNAVRRNRLKRVIRAELSQSTQVDLWIRLQNRFRLPAKILTKDWLDELRQAVQSVG